MTASTILAFKPAVAEPSKSPGARLFAAVAEALAPAAPAHAVALSTPGRCLLPDGFRHVCEAVEISPQGLKIVCEAPTELGDALSAHFRDLGEIRGVVESRGEGWLVLALQEPPERLETLARRLAWCVRRHAEGAAERRRSPRVEQTGRVASLKTADGREIVAEMLDLSQTGAALRLPANAPFFWVGQEVRVDGALAKVRRHFAGGIGVEFLAGA